ncbi:hypothetical protein C0989_012011 [Termitomyces sp. Mn162]|nr:hypothetical protein C0989_012011 [Termitomyces sp. Mn162]
MLPTVLSMLPVRAQAAYERICAGIGTWWDLVAVMLGFWPRGVIRTTFVNVASLGDFEDEQKHGAIAVEFLILNWTVPFRNELEYFCIMHPHWAIADLPDPKDTKDPTRYAALAGMAYLLCDAFNRRIELGLPRDAPPIVEDWEELACRSKVLECVPQWAKKVAPLPTMSYIPGENGQTVDEDDTEVCERLKKFNLIMRQPHIHFI